MKAVVDVRLRGGALVVVIDYGAQRLPAHLHREGQNGGVAAAQRRQGAAAKIIGGAAAFPGLLIHVAVTVDPARKHEPPGGIDGLAGLQGSAPIQAIRPSRTPMLTRRALRAAPPSRR